MPNEPTPGYRVVLEQFEGPLELLLNLIEREELDITEVSLARVADQFLAYVAEREDIPLSDLAGFLSVASRLILIKSRALLPVLSFTEEEEESIADLELHLKLYQKYRAAAGKLQVLFGMGRTVFGRDSFLGVESVFYPPQSATGATLRDAFASLLGDIPVKTDLPVEEIRRIVTLEEKIFHLKESLTERATASFHEFIGEDADRVTVIVSFLALLELIKQRYISVTQEAAFGGIHMERLEARR